MGLRNDLDGVQRTHAVGGDGPSNRPEALSQVVVFFFGLGLMEDNASDSNQ